MQNRKVIRTYSIDDRDLIELFREIYKNNKYQQYCKFEIIPGSSINLDEIEDLSEYEGSKLIQEVTSRSKLKEGHIDLLFQRSISRNSNDGQNRSIFEPSMSLVEFHFRFEGSVRDGLGFYKNAVMQIEKRSFQSDETEDRDDHETIRQLISNFSTTHDRMLKELSSKMKELEARRQSLEKEFEARRTAYEVEHNEKLKKIQEERSQLDLDSHKATRRRILREINETSVDRARRMITPIGARASRWGVFFAAIVLSVIAAILSYVSIVQVGITDQETQIIIEKLTSITTISEAKSIIQGSSIGEMKWYLIARSILGSILTIGSLVFAANWLRRFYTEEIETAREIERYNFDLNRATWAIETILEVQKEHNGSVPEEWIQGATRGLFEQSHRNTSNEESAQALGALLGLSATASFGPDGARFVLNRKGLKKLGKVVEEAGGDANSS